MACSVAIDQRSLEWSGRLSAVLLNDGTDVMRWFLLENLPRWQGKEPNLQEVLNQNKNTLLKLCYLDEPLLNQEMLDILFREDEKSVEIADLEIHVLFILIRFLCRVKHPSWKWWNEDPLAHQTTPLFDVIRLYRFKQQMKEIVHSYNITKESFHQLLDYITEVLDRLRCYKVSARRWRDDVIKNPVESSDGNAYVKLVEVMRWQTTNLKERNEFYLTFKESRGNVFAKEGRELGPWNEFISDFGQKRSVGLLHVNRPKSAKNDVCEDDTGGLITKYNKATLTPAFQLNQIHLEHFKESEMKLKKKTRKQDLSEKSKLNQEEYQILRRINNDVFIKDSSPVSPESFASNIAERIRELYITRNFEIVPLPQDPGFRIHMDHVTINVCAMDKQRQRTNLLSWRDMLQDDTPFRFVVGGEWSSGKTTLLKKICYDWATKNAPPQLLSHQFVFYIDSALIISRSPYTSLSECILEQCCENFTIDEVESLFHKSDGRNILLIFDAVERMPDGRSDAMSELNDIICGQKWPKCSVIISTLLADVGCGCDQIQDQNIDYFISGSLVPWQKYFITGFTTNDVVVHARLYLKYATDKSGEDPVLTTRKFLSFCRTFQRDVYKGILTLPSMTFFICFLWKSGNSIFPETLGDIFKHFFENFKFSDDFSVFWDEVVHRTMDGKSGNFYDLTSSEAVHDLTRRGILIQQPNRSSHTKFTHILFEDYCAACWLCLHFTDEYGFDEGLKKTLSSLQSAVRLRFFLLFCCSLSSDVAETITSKISDLLQDDKNDFPSVHLQEAAKHLTLQSFYEINGVTSKSFLTRSAKYTNKEEELSLNGGSELRLRDTRSLSNRSKQAAFLLTSHCRPALTRSGTVFPFFNVSTFWIRSLHLSRMRGKQMSFVASLLINLPFLEVAIFDKVSDVQDEDVSALCLGLKNSRTSTTFSALQTLTFTQHLTSPFDLCTVSSYKCVGELLEHLPYLDSLNLTIPTEKLFFSLFITNSQTVVPLTEINLTKSGISATECFRLATLLPRLIFVQKLILSHNRLEDGFAMICNKLYSIRNLEVLDVSSSCLSIESIVSLSRALRKPKTCSSLEHLDLSNNQVHCEEVMLEVATSARFVSRLRFLDMSNNYLGDKGACVLAKSLNEVKCIEVLKLNFVQMRDVGLSSFKHNLRDCQSLSSVSLAGNYFASNVLEFLDILKGALYLSGASSLERLDLSGIDDKLKICASSNSVNIFIEAIRRNTKIECIILRHIEINFADLVLILNACLKHTSLKELHLSKSLTPLDEEQVKAWSFLKLS